MALTCLFKGTVPKHVESPDDNEDAYLTDPERGRVVVSDGASESFDALNWARLLVDRMMEEELSPEAVASCLGGYEALHDASRLSWSKAAAYERGSFATLLIAQDHPERNMVQITAAGDSLAVWVDGGQLLASAPYIYSEQFLEKPVLLATRLSLNATGDEQVGTWQWGYEEQGHRLLLCMTDALGAWLLAHQEKGDQSALEALCGIREVEELVELVERERGAGRLRRDDSTLVIVSVTQS
ncbi:hypothetical protein [Xanthomonas oryzae]|uniref:Protein phosphatase 2C domain-containing protein n=1 Tax=Xanthomonas oryzae pv. leersiae TaxID=3112258 RepID=A0AAJ6H105_9XANT|nr:hypothetical protein [Xanthomonas oryzae]WIX07566.1 hypothetical protein QN060_05735 [Xanthomonas oryzae pv. oryzae]